MSFTDIFIRRPVLATVVSLLILLVGLARGVQSAGAAVSRDHQHDDHHHDRLSRRQRGADQGLHHHAHPAGGGERRRHRHADVVVAAERQHHHARTCASTPTRIAPSPTCCPRSSRSRACCRARRRIRSSSSRPASTTALMYMSFNSKVLTASQITDYLTRVVQPQAADDRRRRQRADPGRADLRHAHLAQSRQDGGARRHAARRAHGAHRQQFHFGRRPDQGRLRPDDHQRARPRSTAPTAFGKLVVATRGDALVRLDDIADIELGPESANSSSVFDGLKAVFIGVYSHADRQSADRHRQRAQGVPGHPAPAAGGHGSGHRL